MTQDIPSLVEAFAHRVQALHERVADIGAQVQSMQQDALSLASDVREFSAQMIDDDRVPEDQRDELAQLLKSLELHVTALAAVRVTGANA